MNQPFKLNLQSTMKDVDVLMSVLFTQKQDSAFTVFDNLTDAQILATLKNKNIGLNKTSTALVLVVNYDGTLYKKTIVDTVAPTPTVNNGMPDFSTEVAKSNNVEYTATTDLYAIMISNAGSVVDWGVKITYDSVLYDFATMDIYNANDTTVPFTIKIPNGSKYEFKNCSVKNVYEFIEVV